MGGLSRAVRGCLLIFENEVYPYYPIPYCFGREYNGRATWILLTLLFQMRFIFTTKIFLEPLPMVEGCGPSSPKLTLRIFSERPSLSLAHRPGGVPPGVKLGKSHQTSQSVAVHTAVHTSLQQRSLPYTVAQCRGEKMVAPSTMDMASKFSAGAGAGSVGPPQGTTSRRSKRSLGDASGAPPRPHTSAREWSDLVVELESIQLGSDAATGVLRGVRKVCSMLSSLADR